MNGIKMKIQKENKNHKMINVENIRIMNDVIR